MRYNSETKEVTMTAAQACGLGIAYGCAIHPDQGRERALENYVSIGAAVLGPNAMAGKTRNEILTECFAAAKALSAELEVVGAEADARVFGIVAIRPEEQ